jgi:hypothetical protein
MEFIVDEILIRNPITCTDIPNDYIVGIDLSLEANIFYGIKSGNTQYERVCAEDFDEYDMILRLSNWNRGVTNTEYCFRVLKANKNDKVNFDEEKEYLKCRML